MLGREKGRDGSVHNSAGQCHNGVHRYERILTSASDDRGSPQFPNLIMSPRVSVTFFGRYTGPPL
jgi:hypothetical protein